MKVSVKKIRGVAGDMQLVLLRDTEFVDLDGEKRSTKERVYRIEVKMTMGNGRSYVADVHVSKFADASAGPAVGRFPVVDLEDLNYTLRGIEINRDFDPKNDWKVLNAAADALVSAYAQRSRFDSLAPVDLKDVVDMIEKVEA